MNSSSQRRTRKQSPLWVRLFFISTVVAAAAQAQAAPPPTDLTISVEVRLVALQVTVRNGKGAIATGLGPRNFKVYENGILQTLRSFRAEDIPVAVGLIVDHSGSMRSKLPDVTAAAVAFTRASNPNDDIFVVRFNERVTLGLPDTKLFSASPAELGHALMRSHAAGETALYDAVSSALTHIQKSTIDKKVLIVISDGADNASKHSLEQALHQIEESDVEVYTIGLFDAEDPDTNSHVLRHLAGAGGGDAFLPKQSADAVGICESIAKDIRTQYTLTYSPSDQAFHGEYRGIRVRVSGDNGAKLKARARAGYIATPVDTAGKEGRK
jgi:Ca-activated chloride channel homolog